MTANLDPPLARGINLALGEPLAREVELRGVRSIEVPREEGTRGVDVSKSR